MKKILGYLRLHVKEDFHLPYYVAVLLFLAVSLGLNYSLNFSDNYLDTLPGIFRIVGNFLFFAVAYFIPLFLLVLLKPKWRSSINRKLILKSAFGLLLLSSDKGFPYLTEWLAGLPDQLEFWSYKVSTNMLSMFTVVSPMMIYYGTREDTKWHAYGLTNLRFDWCPYLIMLAIMFPCLIGASMFEGFQQQYPMYKTTVAHEYLQWPEYMTVLIYEIAYGLDFITVELLFRGFFVIGMISLLGRNAIVPMACMYCFLHFGKPPAEAISSIFGGFVLGVIAYETRSIWGGVIVHLGIAWFMELIAYLQKTWHA